MHCHMINNYIIDDSLSAYKASYNDIVTIICRCNGAMLVLLYLTPLIMIICFVYLINM